MTVCRVSSCASVSGSADDVSSGTGAHVLQFEPGAVDRVRTWNVALLTVTAVCASHSRDIAPAVVVEVSAINPVGTAMLVAVPTTAVAAELPSAVDTKKRNWMSYWAPFMRSVKVCEAVACVVPEIVDQPNGDVPGQLAVDCGLYRIS